MDSLCCLPDVLLVNIFTLCDLHSLAALSCTCSKFSYLIKCNSVWKRHYRNFTCVHYSFPHSDFNLKKRPINSYKEFCKFSLKWRKGEYRTQTLKRIDRQLPWIVLDSDNCLWSSDKNVIKYYQLSKNSNISDVTNYKCDSSDVNRFTVKNDIVVCGYRDGSASCFSKCSKHLEAHFKNIHTKEIQTVDIFDDLIITGSFDHTVKIFSKDPKKKCVDELSLGDRVLSLVATDCHRLGVGTAGVNRTNDSPISVWDLERAQLISYVGQNFKYGAGIMDIKSTGSNNLITCGYDTYIRVWDLRSSFQKSVVQFEEPGDSSVYCIASDYKNVLVSGSSRFSQAHLWDIRKASNQPIQAYRMKHHNSPVYSLAFSPKCLFMGLDKFIVKMVFDE